MPIQEMTQRDEASTYHFGSDTTTGKFAEIDTNSFVV